METNSNYSISMDFILTLNGFRSDLMALTCKTSIGGKGEHVLRHTWFCIQIPSMGASGPSASY